MARADKISPVLLNRKTGKHKIIQFYLSTDEILVSMSCSSIFCHITNLISLCLIK